MPKKISMLIVMDVTASLLGACGKETPKCSDDDTYSLVTKIVLGHLGGGEGLSEKEIKENIIIEYPRATAFDEAIKKYSCEAKLIVGGKYSVPITYASQIDDKGQHIVSLGGIMRGDLLHLQAGMIENIKEGRERSGNAVKSTGAMPEPKAAESSTPVISPSPDSKPQPVVEMSTASLQASLGPSFNCDKASTFSEKTICSEPLLGKLDGALAENYRYMLASNIDNWARGDLKATQRSWLAVRNKCLDVECLMRVYRTRVDEVCDYPVVSGVHPICVNSDEIK